MPIDTERETLVSFSDARSSFRDGRRKSLATLHRWRLRGINGVKLETCLVGGMRFTSLEAIERFIRALNRDDIAPPAINASQRKRQGATAQAQLKEMGISKGANLL